MYISFPIRFPEQFTDYLEVSVLSLQMYEDFHFYLFGIDFQLNSMAVGNMFCMNLENDLDLGSH